MTNGWTKGRYPLRLPYKTGSEPAVTRIVNESDGSDGPPVLTLSVAKTSRLSSVPSLQYWTVRLSELERAIVIIYHPQEVGSVSRGR